jgi:hypothetical protein
MFRSRIFVKKQNAISTMAVVLEREQKEKKIIDRASGLCTCSSVFNQYTFHSSLRGCIQEKHGVLRSQGNINAHAFFR